jgi:hypothetical protein
MWLSPLYIRMIDFMALAGCAKADAAGLTPAVNSQA